MHAVGDATGKPAVLGDLAVKHRPEQGSDRFESAHLIATKRGRVITFEGQHGDA